MCVAQIKPVTQLGLSSQFDNIKFWNVKAAFRTKFPFLLPSVMMSLKSCRPYSDLSRPGVLNCYFPPAASPFTWEWRTHSRPRHVKDLFSRQRENKNNNQKNQKTKPKKPKSHPQNNKTMFSWIVQPTHLKVGCRQGVKSVRPTIAAFIVAIVISDVLTHTHA